MNVDNLTQMLNDYLKMLQESNADNEKINQVKLMIWAIQDEIKLQKFLNNLQVSRYRR